MRLPNGIALITGSAFTAKTAKNPIEFPITGCFEIRNRITDYHSFYPTISEYTSAEITPDNRESSEITSAFRSSWIGESRK
jgi:hypothetical protein